MYGYSDTHTHTHGLTGPFNMCAQGILCKKTEYDVCPYVTIYTGDGFNASSVCMTSRCKRLSTTMRLSVSVSGFAYNTSNVIDILLQSSIV